MLLRASTAPFVRASANASADWSAVMPAVTVASVGAGDGYDGLPVIAVTTLWAYVMRAGTVLGSERMAIDLFGGLVLVNGNSFHMGIDVDVARQ